MPSEIPNCNLIDLILLLTKRRRRFRVQGLSMLPLLLPYEEILVDLYIYQRSNPQINDIAIAHHPFQKNLLIVKRIIDIKENQWYFVQGDNLEASTDSRHFGFVNRSLIIGKVVKRFP